jgi:ubiquinone/menaquinone biosynthesis C-methylase UbiE
MTPASTAMARVGIGVASRCRGGDRHVGWGHADANRLAAQARQEAERVSASATERYVPAAGRAAFTGAYDAVLALTMRERSWRPVLVDAVLAGVASGGTVVDVGAGTGTLAIALAEARPDVAVVAVDGDPRVQELARRKAGAERVRWRRGLAQELPLPDGSADRVVTSLLLHHLGPDGKRAALAEARRVLRPGGRLHVADWGRPADPLMRAAFLALQLIDGFAGTRDHAAGRLPRLIADAGFADVRARLRLRTTWGSLELLDAARP